MLVLRPRSHRIVQAERQCPSAFLPPRPCPPRPAIEYPGQAEQRVDHDVCGKNPDGSEIVFFLQLHKHNIRRALDGMVDAGSQPAGLQADSWSMRRHWEQGRALTVDGQARRLLFKRLARQCVENPSIFFFLFLGFVVSYT